MILFSRDYAYPKPVAMAVAQFIMAISHIFFAMGWPRAMYIGTLLIGLGYGVHWAIVPAVASELFGLKKFGALYNFLTLANPASSLVFSAIIASSTYDREVENQAHQLLENLVLYLIQNTDSENNKHRSISFMIDNMYYVNFRI